MCKARARCLIWSVLLSAHNASVCLPCICLSPWNSGSSFISNAASRGGSGGAMWVEDGAAVSITATSFVNNSAASSYTHKGAGGAIAVSSSGWLELEDGCSLEDNFAGPEVRGYVQVDDAPVGLRTTMPLPPIYAPSFCSTALYQEPLEERMSS